MKSWTNLRYLEEQQMRLPSARYRRLHLNLGGQPEGAALSGEKIEAAVRPGRKVLPYTEGIRYYGFVDMSGGSSDDATCAVAHRSEDGKLVLDMVMNQGPRPPFDPRQAVRRFAAAFREYHVSRVKLDPYAGRTFVADFEADGFACTVHSKGASELYESLEAHLNAGEAELLDVPTLVEQLVGLVWKGGKVTHVSGEHDDWANATAGALLLAVASRRVAYALPDYQSSPRADDDDEPGVVLDSGGALGDYQRRARRGRGIPDGW